MHGLEFIRQPARPVFQHFDDRHAVDHSEGQVEVGPAVALRERQRADDRPGHHSAIGRSQLKHPIAHPFTVLDGVHIAYPFLFLASVLKIVAYRPESKGLRQRGAALELIAFVFLGDLCV